MFCCDDKRKKQQECCCKGLVIGGILAVASIVVVKICKKIKCRKIEKIIFDLKVDDTDKIIEELEMEEMDEKDKGEDDTKKNTEYDPELKEKIDEFNSRRLTTENETLHERL